jgi:hypothetical protein
LLPVVTVRAVALPYLLAPRVPSVYRWLRSRPVADACGDPVLRDQDPDRPAGHGKADACLDAGTGPEWPL